MAISKFNRTQSERPLSLCVTFCRVHLKYFLRMSSSSSSSSSSSRIYPPPIQDLHPQGLTSQMPVGQMPVGGATVSGPEHQTDTQGRASLNVWSAQCQGRRQHRTEHKGLTPNPRTEIKIPHPAGNRTRAAGLEGRNSTDHATVTDSTNVKKI